VGIGSGLSLAFNTTLGGVRLYYGASKANSSTVGTGGLIAFNANNTWRGKSAQVSLEVSYEGKVKVWIDGTLVFNDIQLPAAYLQEDFTYYGGANFSMEILEVHESKEEVNKAETRLIRMYSQQCGNRLYNIAGNNKKQHHRNVS
jgi:hypothetical protein